MKNLPQVLIKEDTKKYRGKWVVAYNQKVIAHGSNPIKVYKKAKKLYPTEDLLFPIFISEHGFCFKHKNLESRVFLF